MSRLQVMAIVAGTCGACLAWGGIEGVRLGDAAPPATIGGVAVIAAPFDDGIFDDVFEVTDGYDGVIRVAGDRGGAVSRRQIGLGWATWSHGYTGNVYYSGGSTGFRVHFRAGTKAVYLYAEPGPFGLFPFTVTASDGTSTVVLDDMVEGFAGAKGWGFYGTGLSDVKWVHVNADVSISVGEFATSEPCYADINMDGFVDFVDYLEFLTLYEVGDSRIDFSGDGLVDFSDYLVFLNMLGNSCDED